MTLSITVDLPDSLVHDLEKTAVAQKQSIADVLRDLLLRYLPASPPLPDDVELELAAMANLSDDALWILARGSLATDKQRRLAALNEISRDQNLSPEQERERDELLALYDRTLVRRAQAASLLTSRGYEMDSPDALMAQ